MEAKLSLLNPFLEKVENFSKSNIDLLKLKFIDKASDFISFIFARLLFILIFSFFIISLSVAMALWIGELMGKNYYGFFVVSLFYGVVGIILWLMQPFIKISVNNWIINKILN